MVVQTANTNIRFFVFFPTAKVGEVNESIAGSNSSTSKKMERAYMHTTVNHLHL